MAAEQPTDIDPYLIARDDVIPAEGWAAFPLYQSQMLRITDLEGKQVTDLICFDMHDPEDKLSVHSTLIFNGTISITRGHTLFSTKARRMLTIVDDTVGVHDLIAGSCSAESNEYRYGVRNTPSCRGNFEAALAPHSIPPREIPFSFSIFMSLPVAADGTTAIQESPSRPGDHIDLRADMDLLVALSSCPQRRNACNGFNPSPIRVTIYETEPAGKTDGTRGP